MPRYAAERVLLAPVEDVWAFVAEPYHLSDWWPGITGVEPGVRGFTPGARWKVHATKRNVFAGLRSVETMLLVREIDLVVHCDRPRTYINGERSYLPRRVDQIVELAGIEGMTPTLNPLFEGAGPVLVYLNSGPAFLPDLQAAGFQR